MTAIPAFPLFWPAGKKRTPLGARMAGKFGRAPVEYGEFGRRRGAKRPLTVAQAIQRLHDELGRLGTDGVVISTNVEVRQDGLPYSNRRNPDDPGAAIYFHLATVPRKDRKPIVLACDLYRTVEDNLAAIAAHIGAMRTAERHGVGTLSEMFRGFQALTGDRPGADWFVLLDHPGSLTEAEATYRRKAAAAHPDIPGGSEREMADLNAAIVAARQSLGG